jgi:acyl carrier protein
MSEQYPIPTPEERAADRRALFEKCPTPANRFALMFGKCSVLDTVKEVLEENGFISNGDDFDPNITFQELNMDSLDITRFVVEIEGRLGIEIDTEKVYPTTVIELVNIINENCAKLPASSK